MLSQSSYDTFFNWSSASSTYWNPHFIMASQTIQLVQIICYKTRSAAYFPSVRIQFNPTSRAIKMIRMVNLSTKFKRLIINYTTKNQTDQIWISNPSKYILTLVTNIFAHSNRFNSGVAFVTQSSSCIFNETWISQFDPTFFATETVWMPVWIHGLYNSTDDESSTLIAAWREEDLKIVFAIFSSFEFIKDTIFKLLETLSTPEK